MWLKDCNQELNNHSNCCSFVKATNMLCEGTEVRPSTLHSAGADPAFALKNYKGQHISLFKELFFFSCCYLGRISS